jgi:hypothetical protein
VDLAGAVGGDDHQRRRGGRHRADLGDGELVVGEDLEQEGLERLVGPVDLVDEQDRRAGRIRLERLEERPLHQEPLREEVVLDARAIHLVGRLGDADLQHLTGVVPLVGGRGQVQPLVALQAEEAPAQRAREDLRHLGLAHSGLPFQEERARQAERQEERGGQAPVGDVVAFREELHHRVDGARQRARRAHGPPSPPTLTRRRRPRAAP